MDPVDPASSSIPSGVLLLVDLDDLVADWIVDVLDWSGFVSGLELSTARIG